MRRWPLVLLLILACRHEAPRPPVILISIDTLRSDHLPAYGYRAIRTPAIDRLAADGIVFDHAYAHVPMTLPSHATIMTGQLPPANGVRDNAGFRLDPKTPTIASILHDHGYATGAAVSAYVLRRETNIATGFDFYDDKIRFIEGAPTGNLQRDGNETAQIATNWLNRQRAAGSEQRATGNRQPATANAFLFLHLFEPHAPYEPSYDGEIVKADAIVGRFLDALGTTYDDALIILLSDHGEGLREHGEQEHGVLLYREALQVPLIVKLPRAQRRGTRVGDPVGLVDVLPTITSLLELPTQGVSLLAKHTPRPLYAESLYSRIHLGWSELFSIVRYPFHLIDGPRPELYRIDDETHDVSHDDRRTFADLRRDLAAIPHGVTAAPRVDAEEAKKLAALGYVSAGATHASNLNPREHLGDLDALKRVTELMSSRQFKLAAKEIEELLARNPGWSDLRNDLGLAYEQLGDLAGAERVYRDAIRTTPELAPDFALSLASVLLDEGKLDDAEAHARVALAANPGGAHMLLAGVALRRQDERRALDEAHMASEHPSTELAAKFLTAQILATRRDFDGTLVVLREIDAIARARNVPLPRRFFFLLGDTLARMGRTSEAIDAFERELRVNPANREAAARLDFLRR